MGYNSHFLIKIGNLKNNIVCEHSPIPEDFSFCPYCGAKKVTLESIEVAISELSQYYVYEYDHTGDTLAISDSKWYEWEDHMAEISKQFECLFVVTREGENSLDIEKCYFYKGKSFNPGKVIITFENDTEEKRKEALGI